MFKRIFSIAWLLACWLAVGAPVAYFVDDGKGNDENPGEKSAPFRTIRRALRQYRMLALTRSIPKGGVRIVLAPGRYEMENGITLTAEESTDAEHPLEIDGGGQAVFSGSLVLQRSDFLPVADEAVLKRLPQVAHGRVLACDLMTRGVTVGLPPNGKNDEKSFGELFVGIPNQEEDGRLPDRNRMSQVKQLEELDCIGKWCLEADSMVLYALLPKEAGSAMSPIEFSRLSKPFFTLEKCSGVCFRNLTFECSLSDGVVIDGDDNEVVGCVFRNLAGTGVIVRGKRNLIQSVDVHDVGTEAISVAENCDNEIRDCHVSHIGTDYTANMAFEPLRQILLSTTAKGNIGQNAPAVRNGVSPSSLPRGRFTAAKVKARVDIDGTLLREEWDATAVCGRVRIETEPSRVDSYVGPEIPSFWKQHEAFTPAVKRGPPCTLYVMAGADGLYAAFDVLTTGVRPLVTEGSWNSMEGVVLMFGPLDSSATTVFHGLVSGKFQMNREMVQEVRYAAKVLGDAQWRCEWFIPWNALGGRPASGTAIGFNAAVLQGADSRTLMWRESKGELVIP